MRDHPHSEAGKSGEISRKRRKWGWRRRALSTSAFPRKRLTCGKSVEILTHVGRVSSSGQEIATSEKGTYCRYTHEGSSACHNPHRLSQH